MTITDSHVVLTLGDFRFLEALGVAFEASYEADMSFRHDPVQCDQSGECVCPELPSPPRDTISAALDAALSAVLPEALVRGVMRLCSTGSTMAEALTVAGVRFR